MPPPYQYLFGPVASRRFGRSLGVDLQAGGAKICSLDCLFCQIGTTPATTIERRAAVPIEAVLAELDDWRRGGGTADFVTLSGSGEPTLHPRFGEIFAWVRRATPCARCCSPTARSSRCPRCAATPPAPTSSRSPCTPGTPPPSPA